MKIQFNIEVSVLIWAAFMAVMGDVQGQDLSNFRSKPVAVEKDTIRLDTVSIVPGSLVITGTGLLSDSLVSSDYYEVDPLNARLVWAQRPLWDSVVVSYRVFPFLLTKPYFHKDPENLVQSPDFVLDPFKYTPAEAEPLLQFGGLDYNGSFSRGLSFGNAQNVVLNSSFNLQLAGELGDGVEILAAMTDNNIPIQPEGNTQQIQEFDKVFIQLRKNRSELTVGDFELLPPESYFLTYYKKLQGAKGSTVIDVGEKWQTGAGASFAVSKGQYARQNINGEEGNQGPYKLAGNNGETFIIVLAGTERVYLDGQLLLRGADNDYIIDYNTAELTFTPNVLITKDSRLVVEFEYSVEYYFRSLVHIQNEWSTDRLNIKFNLYNEQDAKNQPILQELDPSLRQVLFQAGDSIQNALAPGWRPDTAEAGSPVTYRLTDTTVNSITYDSVFIYDPAAENPFIVRFSKVGEGNGFYRISEQGLNRRVYEWVAPVNGELQGSYMPFVQVISPKQSRMLTLSGSYKLGKDHVIGAEVAVSKKDVNTFSDLHDADDRGLGTTLRYGNRLDLKKDNPGGLMLLVNGQYEFVSDNFQPVESYRDIEFSRNWNTGQIKKATDEHLGTIRTVLQGKEWGTAGYSLSSFVKPGIYRGFTHGLNSDIRMRGLRFISASSFLHSQGEGFNTSFLRPKVELSHRMPFVSGWRVGVRGEMEDNQIQTGPGDSLTASSFYYHQYEVFVQTADTLKNQAGFSYSRRNDRLPANGEFKNTTLANTLSAFGKLLTNPKSQLKWQATYRRLSIDDTSLTNEQPEESILGRLEYNFTLLKGMLRSGTLYEVGSGQEQKREFSYIKVPVGQGNYIWNDDGDGIEELDEFEQASEIDLSQADYIRVLTPTDVFIRANITQFNQVLNLDPKAMWSNKKGFLKFLSRFSNVTTLQLSRKVVSDVFLESVNPFNLNVTDEKLISANSLIRNTLYFNRIGADFGAEFNFQDARTKMNLINGPESRRRLERTLRIRWKISRIFFGEIIGSNGFKANLSEAYIERNYVFDFYKINPELTFQKGTDFRLSAEYNYSKKSNRKEYGGEEARIHDASLNVRYNILSRSTLNGKFTFATVNYPHPTNDAISYALLEGLQDGRNYIWTITYERKLANNIQMGVSYEGKKTGNNAVIHTGRAQLSAIF